LTLGRTDVIAIVSSSLRERIALSALCEQRGWACAECDSVRALKRLLRRSAPRVLVIRQKLSDGYSDDVIAFLRSVDLLGRARMIVLLGPAASSAQEARQIALGAEIVLRDPVRSDVLAEYLAKYNALRNRLSQAAAGPMSHVFAGGRIDPRERILRHADKTVSLTPREVALVELLRETEGSVVSYESLYEEVIGRRFRGDTSNLRVLLAKLDGSFRAAGLVLRDYVEVIAKTGYRYHSAAPDRSDS
jgi:DNA-binding response OmpR family regulator